MLGIQNCPKVRPLAGNCLRQGKIYANSITLVLSEPVHAPVRWVDNQLDHIRVRALKEDPIAPLQVSEEGEFQD